MNKRGFESVFAHAVPLHYWRMWRNWYRDLKRFCNGKESVAAVFELPFLDVIHKGYWEPWGIELLKREGIAYDFSVRGTPPASVRFKEWVKNVIFRLNPDLVTRIQNVFNVGKK